MFQTRAQGYLLPCDLLHRCLHIHIVLCGLLIYTTTARHTPGGSIYGIQPLSGHIPIFFNYIHNHIHILLADFFTLRFHHNTHNRLCS